ncbi:uncharacterized protein Tco025E_04903 [Trypanosoma conorhini]|uniref:Uncharacterized protein n=1 Tax=Trypanosoma conorhini TaxID=83891 RepID=A0A3R7P4F0_9TRYP|nr:uncharacterized protein Tco025E_04903 [Trypanosoma conorhini]RNF17201.1 hypothetical protein Tco025E_04903 [Trypanosoma conorhini]
MLGLSGVQQPPHPQQASRAKARRCLYCQQQGCQGLRSCWWPRLQSSASRFHREAAAGLPRHLWDGEVNSEQEPVSAIEENLRTQIRVLEREVELLRTGLQQLSSINRRGRTDVATMTSSELTLPQAPSSSLSCGHNVAGSGSDVPLPKRAVAPPWSGGGLQPPPLQEQLQLQHKAVHEAFHVNSSHSQGISEAAGAPVASVSAPPPLQGSAVANDVEELKPLVWELTAQNASLRRQLAEMKVVVEQRDALLRSILVEGPASYAAPASSPAQASAVSPRFRQVKELLSQLLQAQEELARLREEARQWKAIPERFEENPQGDKALVEGLRRQPRQFAPPSQEHSAAASTANTNAASTPSMQATHASDPVHPTIAAVGAEAKNTGPTVRVEDAFASAPKERTATEATPLTAELRELQERLAAAERKVLAWETWYRQHMQRPSCKDRESQTKAGDAAADAREGGTAPMNPKPPQQPFKVLLRALPVADPTRYVNLDSLPSWQQQTVSDALAIDTYALMAREAALRQVAEQERAELLAALSMESVTDMDQDE